jgi:hypothetical protein
MANPEHLAILKQGVEAWNRWRNEHPEVRPDLIGEDLSEAELGHADIRWADLIGANLSSANLIVATLNETDLHGANLTGVNLCLADLSGADLDQADLTRAAVGHTSFANVDLSSVKGLTTVIHEAPSTIGIDTIYKSKGKIPHIFLRGCGVPEIFITYMESLVSQAIEFYSLFISHSSKNKDFAQKLHDDLQSNGVRCWLDNEDIKGGRKLHEQIDEAIRSHDKLLLILSPESMASEWVKTEIAKARKREIKEGKQLLFPVRLCSFETLRDWECFDSDTGKDSAKEIREYMIPDFSDWENPASYQKAFEKLLRDLKGDPKPISI